MPDEKRIKDFEPATELLIDDWFAVDSPSQGTRKMQASMFQEGLQTQITANTENIALHSGQISVLQQGVGNIGDKVDVLGAAVTVEAYSASKLYAVGDDCVYEGVRYKCITAIETPEAFDPNKWQAISIEGELNELNSSLNNLTPLQRGERSVTLNANAQTEFEVVLQRPFTGGSDYAAFVQVEYYGAASYLSAPLIRNKLYDRFVVRIHNNSTAQQTVKILWLVIAY